MAHHTTPEQRRRGRYLASCGFPRYFPAQAAAEGYQMTQDNKDAGRRVDFDALSGGPRDPARIARARLVAGLDVKPHPFVNKIMNYKIPGVTVKGWAHGVFPQDQL